MKDDYEEKPGVFRQLLGLATRNWGLKLLSLVLAILIYHSLKPAGERGALSADRRNPVSAEMTTFGTSAPASVK